MDNKLIINACITGMIPTKDMTANIPVSVEEIVKDGLACLAAGASILHIHARDQNERPTYEKEIFGEIFSGIRKEVPQAILVATTSGRLHNEFWQRSQALELTGMEKPDMASLTLASLNFKNNASINEPGMVRQLAQKMKDNGIMPECEAFDPGMVNAFKLLKKEGYLESPCYLNLLFGNMYSSQARISDISYLMSLVPQDTTIGVAGLGSFQLQANVSSILMGHHVRVGLEDNIWHDNKRKHLATNVGLIQRLKRIAKELYRDTATPVEAREIIGLSPWSLNPGNSDDIAK